MNDSGGGNVVYANLFIFVSTNQSYLLYFGCVDMCSYAYICLQPWVLFLRNTASFSFLRPQDLLLSLQLPYQADWPLNSKNPLPIARITSVCCHTWLFFTWVLEVKLTHSRLKGKYFTNQAFPQSQNNLSHNDHPLGPFSAFLPPPNSTKLRGKTVNHRPNIPNSD